MMQQYRVIKPFSSAGEGGLMQHKVGDIVTRLVLAKSSEYLELIEPARVFVINPADTQTDTDNASAPGGPVDRAALRAEVDSGKVFVPQTTVTGNGSGEALPMADNAVKTGKAQK